MGKPIRVAFLVAQAGFGGGEMNVLSLFERLDRCLVRPILLAPPANPLVQRARAEGWEYRPINPAPFLSTSSEWRGRKFVNPLNCGLDMTMLPGYTGYLASILLDVRAEVVQTSSIFAHLCGGWAARRLGIASVWQLGDIVSPNLAFGLPNRLCRELAAQQSAVVVPSQATKAAYADATNIKVVSNGVDVATYDKADGRVVRIEFGIPHDAPLVTIVGRLTRWKGQDVFINAAAKLRQTFPTARFLVVGAAEFEGNDYAAELKAQAAALGLEDCLSFTGRRADVPAILKASDVVAHCSRQPEPFGLVIIEAMAAGKVVVATNLGGPLEIITPGVDGMLVEPDAPAPLAEAITRLLRNRTLAQHIGSLARNKVAQQFSTARFVASFTDLYGSIAGKANTQQGDMSPQFLDYLAARYIVNHRERNRL